MAATTRAIILAVGLDLAGGLADGGQVCAEQLRAPVEGGRDRSVASFQLADRAGLMATAASRASPGAPRPWPTGRDYRADRLGPTVKRSRACGGSSASERQRSHGWAHQPRSDYLRRALGLRHNLG